MNRELYDALGHSWPTASINTTTADPPKAMRLTCTWVDGDWETTSCGHDHPYGKNALRPVGSALPGGLPMGPVSWLPTTATSGAGGAWIGPSGRSPPGTATPSWMGTGCACCRSPSIGRRWASRRVIICPRIGAWRPTSWATPSALPWLLPSSAHWLRTDPAVGLHRACWGLSSGHPPGPNCQTSDNFCQTSRAFTPVGLGGDGSAHHEGRVERASRSGGAHHSRPSTSDHLRRPQPRRPRPMSPFRRHLVNSTGPLKRARERRSC